jgi:glycosyltransferase involved in cell wall biosynthesis
VRILHVLGTLSPHYGGPATLLPQLAKAQAAAGHQVVIATTTTDYPTGTYHKPGWDTLPDSEVAVFFASVDYAPLQISRSLTTFLRRNIRDFDVVTLHGLYRFPSTAAGFLARRRGVPYIVVPHGALDPFLFARSTTGKLRLKRLYERLFELPNLQAAAAIHYTAEEERERASFLNLRSPSFVVPNGLDWQPYRALPPRGALRARWGLGEAPIVLFLGRLHLKKGLDLLVPAFDKVRRNEPDAQLVIAGPENDDYGKTVRGWVTERRLDSVVHFVGPLNAQDVVQAFVDADVFVLPSYTENFGVAVAEAMACTCPVVISDQVNIHTAISEVGAGIVTKCDVEETADALQTLLRDPHGRHRMGEAGRRLVQDRYVWPTVVDAMTKEYELVIERAKSHR